MEGEGEEGGRLPSPPVPHVVPSLPPSSVVVLWNQSGTSVELTWRVSASVFIVSVHHNPTAAHNNIHCQLCPGAMYVYTVVFWQPSIHSMRTQTIPERRGRSVAAPQCSHLEWNDLLLCVLSEIKYHSHTYFCTSQILLYSRFIGNLQKFVHVKYLSVARTLADLAEVYESGADICTCTLICLGHDMCQLCIKIGHYLTMP